VNLVFLQHQVRKILSNEAHSLWFRRMQFSLNEGAVVLLGHCRAGWDRYIQAGGDRSVAERSRQGARFGRVRNFYAASFSDSPSSHTLPDEGITTLTKTTHCLLKKTWFSLGPEQLNCLKRPNHRHSCWADDRKTFQLHFPAWFS